MKVSLPIPAQTVLAEYHAPEIRWVPSTLGHAPLGDMLFIEHELPFLGFFRFFPGLNRCPRLPTTASDLSNEHQLRFVTAVQVGAQSKRLG